MTARLHRKAHELEVLVVEDSRHMRHLLRDALASAGIRLVHEAVDGTDACKVLERGTAPDVVITDLVMSPLGGMDLLRLIRNAKTAAHPFIPVIIVSGSPGMEHVQEAVDCGANAFVAKPFTSKHITERTVSSIQKPPMFVRTATYFGPDRRSTPRPPTTGGDCEFLIPCPRRYGEYVRAFPVAPASCANCSCPAERCLGFLDNIVKSGFPMPPPRNAPEPAA